MIVNSIREADSSSEEQLSSIQDITASIEKTSQFAKELRDLLNGKNTKNPLNSLVKGI